MTCLSGRPEKEEEDLCIDQKPVAWELIPFAAISADEG